MSPRGWRRLGGSLVVLGLALQVALVVGVIAPAADPMFGWPPAVLGMFLGLGVSWVGFIIVYRGGLAAVLEAMDGASSVPSESDR